MSSFKSDIVAVVAVVISMALLSGCTLLIQSTMTDGDESLITIKGNKTETTDGTQH